MIPTAKVERFAAQLRGLVVEWQTQMRRGVDCAAQLEQTIATADLDEAETDEPETDDRARLNADVARLREENEQLDAELRLRQTCEQLRTENEQLRAELLARRELTETDEPPTVEP